MRLDKTRLVVAASAMGLIAAIFGITAAQSSPAPPVTGEPPHGPPPPGIPCVQEYDGVRKEFKDPKPDDPTADPKLCRDLRDGRPARDPKTGKFLTTADGKLRRYMPSEPPMPGVSPDEETPQAKAARSKFGGPIIKGNIEVEPKRP